MKQMQRIKPKNKFPETAFDQIKKTELDDLRKIPTIAIKMVK